MCRSGPVIGLNTGFELVSSGHSCFLAGPFMSMDEVPVGSF